MDACPVASLTAALKDDTSFVRAFFRDTLPHDTVVLHEWQQGLESRAARHGRVGGCDREIGLAIECRILTDLTGQVTYPEMLALLSNEAIHGVLSDLGCPSQARPPAPELPSATPTTAGPLSRYSTPWPSPQVITSLQVAHRWANLAEMIKIVSKHAVPTPETATLLWAQLTSQPISTETLSTLISLWVRYDRYGRAQLAALGQPVIVHPPFADGCAVADLIAGETLIDIKASDNPVPQLRHWLRQILSYALLAHGEGRTVNSVGVYHAAEGLLLTWPLRDLLGHNASQAISTDDLAEGLQTALTRDRIAVARRRGQLP